jgi:hypothetical protein
MANELETPIIGTQETEPVTQKEFTEGTVAPKEPTPTEAVAETPTGETLQPEVTTPAEPAQPQADYKQKFVDSQREAILLNERLKQERTRNELLTKQDTPTDEAMRQVYPEWDQLDDYNKRVLIKQEATNMRTAKLELELAEAREERKLDAEIDSLLDSTDPKLTKLQGREAEFRRFAKKPANKGISAETLARAFLFDAEEAPAPAPAPTTRPSLEKGSGGPKEPAKPEGMTLEEEAELMKADPGRYAELIRKGIIK